MKIEFAIAPCSWGIEDPSNSDNPSWETMLDEAGVSGFSGVELGPYGYLPTNPSLLGDVLESKRLDLIAGTIYDDLTGASNIEELSGKTKDICRLLSKVIKGKRKGYLVVIDSVKALRNNTAGHSELAQRMNPENWNLMMNNIKTISKIASEEFGIRPVIHPHAGGYIEFKDETEKLLNDIHIDQAGLCLDTGHLYYAGDDPASSLKQLASRLDYVHFKDINPGVYRKALEEQMGFFDACKLGVMCSIGKGCLDYKSILRILDEIGYRGFVTIEQERDPRDSKGTLDDIITSYNYLVNAER